MTREQVNSREWRLHCDLAGCDAKSDPAAAPLGAELPGAWEGWNMAPARRPGGPRWEHLCPAHAELGR